MGYKTICNAAEFLCGRTYRVTSNGVVCNVQVRKMNEVNWTTLKKLKMDEWEKWLSSQNIPISVEKIFELACLRDWPEEETHDENF